jgi:hypothetical protein
MNIEAFYTDYLISETLFMTDVSRHAYIKKKGYDESTAVKLAGFCKMLSNKAVQFKEL